ncbi:hypothetical protein A2U01_0111585, partial [Trifolium medium]|nr:hypothetical protein [Trifolium medium]
SKAKSTKEKRDSEPTDTEATGASESKESGKDKGKVVAATEKKVLKKPRSTKTKAAK